MKKESRTGDVSMTTLASGVKLLKEKELLTKQETDDFMDILVQMEQLLAKDRGEKERS